MTDNWQALAADACHEAAQLSRKFAVVFHDAGHHTREIEALRKGDALDRLALELADEAWQNA